MTLQVHHTPVFGGSKLPAGRKIENLRQRRIGLQREHRDALLQQESAILAHAEASNAARLSAGRQLGVAPSSVRNPTLSVCRHWPQALRFGCPGLGAGP